jgi:DNA-binding transcriptional LysR family regulator
VGSRRIILEIEREPQDLQAVWRLDSIARLIQQALVKSRTFTSGLERIEIAISPRLVCNDADILLDAAIAHQGIAVLPRFVALNAISQHQLEPVLPEWHIHQVDINALYPSYKDLSPAVNAFVDLAKRYLKTVLDDV